MAVTVYSSKAVSETRYPQARGFHVDSNGNLVVRDSPSSGQYFEVAIWAPGAWHSVELDDLAGPAADK